MGLCHFASHDPRIDRICQDGLPGQPHVAAYLAARLRACRGSVLVARMFVEALRRVPLGRIVTEEDVQRLGVDDQDLLLREVNLACNDALKIDLVCELGAAFHEDSEPYLDGGLSHMRRPLSISRVWHGGELLAIFNCAYAMLRGVDVDPREAARVRASQRPTG